jgi:hypothetical protein
MRLKGMDTIRPPATPEPYPYDLIGMALDYRLRYYFAQTPLSDLMAYRGMTAVEPVGYRLCRPSADEHMAMIKRKARTYSLGDFVLEAVPLMEVRAEDVLAEVPQLLRELRLVGRLLSYDDSLVDDLYTNFGEACSVCGKVFFLGDATVICPNVEEFANSLRNALNKLNPVRRRLSQPQEEFLARYCIVLSLYETIYRSGYVPEVLRRSPAISPLVTMPVDELLTLPRPHWLDDLCTLSWAFFDNSLELLQRPATLNPIFEGSAHVGGADADIIVDGCLIECKTTVDSGLRKLRDWLYQLLGYVLLDYSDNYEIRSLAIFLPRQRTWFRWPLEDLIDKLSDADSPIASGSIDGFSTTLGSLRADFRRLVDPIARRSKSK